MNKLIYAGLVCILALFGAVGEGIFLGKTVPASLAWLAKSQILSAVYIFTLGGLFSLLTLSATKQLGLNVNETGPLASIGMVLFLAVRWGVFRLTPEGNAWLWFQTAIYCLLAIAALILPELPGEILGRVKRDR